MKKIAGAMALVMIAAYIIVNIWISYNHPVVREFQQESEKVSEKIRFVVLSDLHDHLFGEENDELIEKVSQQRQDFILLVGDMLNADSPDTEIVCSLIRRLTEYAPVFAALGNHEKEYVQRDGDLIAQFTAAGAEVLEEKFIDLEIRGTEIRIGGMYEYAFGLRDTENETRQFLESFQKTERLKIMMCHRPDSFIFGDAPQCWDIDLVVSGHNHGGQVVLPFVGGIYGGDQGWFPKYIHGTEHLEKMDIFMTSGLGSNRKKLPRFHNPPEIALIVYEDGIDDTE